MLKSTIKSRYFLKTSKSELQCIKEVYIEHYTVVPSFKYLTDVPKVAHVQLFLFQSMPNL